MSNSNNKFIPADHFFILPNIIFSLGLSTGELSVYSFLIYCENRKTYQCYPSYSTIGRALHLSENTVRKYVHALEDKQFIYTEQTKVRTKNGRIQNGNLLYTIRPIEEAKLHYYEQQFKANEELLAMQRYEAAKLEMHEKCTDSELPMQAC